MRQYILLKMLTVMFIGFKMTDIIDWSWWAIFWPLYAIAGLELLIAALKE